MSDSDSIDYTLRWPPSVIGGEISRLLDAADKTGVDEDWRDEVRLLLRQAFASSIPTEDFERAVTIFGGQSDPVYGDEEPF